MSTAETTHGAPAPGLHGAVRSEPGADDSYQTPGLLFALLLGFFVLEYVRPPGLAALKLQMIFLLVAPLAWLFAKDRPWSSILALQVAFLVVCLKDVPIATNNFSAYMTSRVVYGFVGIALAISWLMSTMSRFRVGVWAWALVMGYSAFYGITHYGLGPGGLMGDENDMALAMCTAFPFAFFGFERFRGLRRWIAAGLGVLFVVCIVASMSRGGFVGLAAVAAFCFFSSRRKLFNTVVGALAIAAFVALAPQSYIDEMKTITERTGDDTGTQRYYLWSTAWNMFKANPITGVGGGNFQFTAGDYQPMDGDWPSHFYQRSWSGTQTHSLYFQVLSEHALPGALVFGGLAWLHFGTLRRVQRRVSEAGLEPAERDELEAYVGFLRGGVVGYLAAGAFLSVALYPYLWYLTAMTVAFDYATRRQLGDEPAAEPA